ncbi:hypothetical protein C8A01DRAFT_48534 [Parachaetomium inaequale]|uniref:Uncharacterized protein n=1 Tax=Parachaetomium inaequale TaxID=2588326 RepID=A0AAN6SPX4_9PEZI|nr:hypothetical protein C8A01DRAFT_48534 [Parachaetomium inaequale]
MAPAQSRLVRNLGSGPSGQRTPFNSLSHNFCPRHDRERKQLYVAYKSKEEYYRGIEVKHGDVDAKAKIEAKLAAGKETLQVRDQVNRRFFSLSEDNRGHVKWILKLQAELHDLDIELASLNAEPPAGPAPPPQPQAAPLTFRSLLHPSVPMSALSHLPDDSHVVILKRVGAVFLTAMREPNVRDFVIRFLFRELLVYKADADELARAARTPTIDAFLRESLDLEYYSKFFTAFREGRSDTFHLLRDAVCGHLLSLQPPSLSSSTTILGAGVATDDTQRRMDARGWDILWGYFHDIVEWWNLEMFAGSFDNFVAVKTLTACLRYGSECLLSVMQGFIGVTKGYRDSNEPLVKIEPGVATERQSRCYLVGRMSKKDLLAQKLAQELGERIARFQVLVYDRETGAKEVPMLNSVSADNNPWFGRFRTASTKDELSSQPWTVDWSLKNILEDVQHIHTLRDRNMAKDYYDFVIIDTIVTIPSKTFDLLDLVADALLKLNRDPPYREVLRKAIQKHAPAEEQDRYLEALEQMNFGPLALPVPTPCQYLGNRVRCWDPPDTLHAHLQASSRDSLPVISLRESRFIENVVSDLESHGVVTRLTAYEPPLTMPVAVRGMDGLDDLYFPYNLGPMDEHAVRGTMLDPSRPFDNLADFTAAYQHAHPAAVFAKGSIRVHYCAWPMPMLRGGHCASGLVFRTPEGRLYRWKTLPFDLPLASRVWQAFVDHKINGKLSFVRLVQTTLVASLEALVEAGGKHGWLFSVPSPGQWTADLGRLGLGSLWEGLRPAL